MDSFATIRERIHQTANIEMFHVNEKESQRALNKLIEHQQEEAQEKAFLEEKEKK